MSTLGRPPCPNLTAPPNLVSWVKKKVPRRVPFPAASLRLESTAAGAGQVLRRNRRAVGHRVAAAPAEDGDAGRHVGGEEGDGAVLHRDHADDAVGRTKVYRSHLYPAVSGRRDVADVLRRRAAALAASPAVGG